MKTFIRGILTTVLVFTFTLIPTIIYAEQTVNQEIIGNYGKEEITRQMTERFEESFPELSEEELNKLEENLQNNEQVDELVDKYSEKIIRDLSEDNIEDVNFEEDLRTFILENKSTIEEASGHELTEEEIDTAIDEMIQNEDLNETYKQIITEAKQEMPEESQTMIDSYNNITSENFMISLVIITVISIIIIALLKKPYYKWIVNIAIAGIISAVFTALIGGCMALVLNLAMASLEGMSAVSATPIIITSAIMLIASIVLLVINSILDKKGNRHAVS